MSSSDFRKLFLRLAGLDPGQIPPTMDESTWRQLSLIALAVSGGGGLPEAPADNKQYARENGAWAEVVASGGGTIPPTLLTPDGDLTLPSPSGSPTLGDKALFYVTPSAGIALRFDSGILIPSDCSFNNSTGKTLTAGKTYIVQLEYLGTAWGLTTIVGGY